MSKNKSYGLPSFAELALALAVVSLGVVACGDDDDSPSTDAGSDDASSAGKSGAAGKAGSGGSKASAGKAGAGGNGGAGGDSAGQRTDGNSAEAGASGSETDGEGKAGAGADSGESTPSETTGGVTLTGIVVDITAGTAASNFDETKYPVVSGVKVCAFEDDSIPCTTTDGAGKYSLDGLPESRDFYLSFQKDSFAPTLFKPYAEIGDELPAISLVSLVYRDSLLQAGAITPDENAGLIYFGASLLDDRGTRFHQNFGNYEIYYLRGYSISIEPAAKAGPVYIDEDWAPDASLTASSPAGWGILQAEPGDYTLTYSHPVVTCPPATTKVVKGWTTLYASAICAVDTGDNDAGI